MPPPHRVSGQASLEYVGVLSLIAVVLGLAGTAVAAPDLAGSAARAIRDGLCRVAGGVCTRAEAREAGLDPCVVSVRARDEHLRVTVAVARLQRGDGLAVERRSDGTASVSVLDGWQGGAETGVGVSLASLDGSATVAGGVTFQGGRTWEFDSVAEAERFAARIAEREDLRGELRGALPFSGDGPALPAPDATHHEGGVFADAGFDGRATVHGQGADVSAGAALGAVLGRRVGDGRTTWSARVSTEALAQLGLVFASLGGATGREGVLEYTTERGRPRTLSVRASASLAGELQVFGQQTDLARLAGSLRAATARGAAGGQAGLAADVAIGLDLRDPANLAAVRRLFAPGDAGPVAALRGLGARLDADGELDLSVHRTTTRREHAGAGARLGAGLAGEVARTTRTRELAQAWAVRGGGPLREREDCSATA